MGGVRIAHRRIRWGLRLWALLPKRRCSGLFGPLRFDNDLPRRSRHSALAMRITGVGGALGFPTWGPYAHTPTKVCLRPIHPWNDDAATQKDDGPMVTGPFSAPLLLRAEAAQSASVVGGASARLCGAEGPRRETSANTHRIRLCAAALSFPVGDGEDPTDSDRPTEAHARFAPAAPSAVVTVAVAVSPN